MRRGQRFVGGRFAGVARAGVGGVSVSRGARGRLLVVSLAIAMDLSLRYFVGP